MEDILQDHSAFDLYVRKVSFIKEPLEGSYLHDLPVVRALSEEPLTFHWTGMEKY